MLNSRKPKKKGFTYYMGIEVHFFATCNPKVEELTCEVDLKLVIKLVSESISRY